MLQDKKSCWRSAFYALALQQFSKSVLPDNLTYSDWVDMQLTLLIDDLKTLKGHSDDPAIDTQFGLCFRIISKDPCHSHIPTDIKSFDEVFNSGYQ